MLGLLLTMSLLKKVPLTFICRSHWKLTFTLGFLQLLPLICPPPPFENRGHFVFHLSVGHSVDQAMSAQYLLTSLLKSCQSWYKECPKEIDVLYWFWDHMVRGQGQTSSLWKNVVHSISLKVSKLGTVDAPSK